LTATWEIEGHDPQNPKPKGIGMAAKERKEGKGEKLIRKAGGEEAKRRRRKWKMQNGNCAVA
jgi:hypothetical protein